MSLTVRSLLISAWAIKEVPTKRGLGFEMPDPRQIPIGPSGTPPKRDLGSVPQPRPAVDNYGMPPPPPSNDKSGKDSRNNKWKLPKRK